MKVGTDGVLLGAWAPLPDEGYALDIGTGSGLLALMIAQRSAGLNILGIDIDANAIEQARENVSASPFADRVEVRQQSFQDLVAERQADDGPVGRRAAAGRMFDVIVCNPPFFEESLLPPDTLRAQARHTSYLPFDQLIHGVARSLAEGGLFSVIMPTPAFDDFHHDCFAEALFLSRMCYVQTTARKPPKRVMATFVKGQQQHVMTDTITLSEGNGRSEAYRLLTRDFYLH